MGFICEKNRNKLHLQVIIKQNFHICIKPLRIELFHLISAPPPPRGPPFEDLLPDILPVKKSGLTPEEIIYSGLTP